MKNVKEKGFNLIELMAVVAIVGILMGIAIPSYNQHVIKASRSAAQTELINLASLQEKIFLNSNNYAFSVTGAYTGNATGGLGLTSGQSKDGKYNITLDIVAVSQTYTLTATPVTGKSQEGDGNISISENGTRLWNGQSW